MSGLTETVRDALDSLIEEGFQLLQCADLDALRASYQGWYTRSLPIVRQLLPDRVDDFILLYEGTQREPAIRYKLMGGGYSDRVPVEKLQMQVGILASAADRLEDRLSNLRGLLQADLFDSEIDAARHLRENGHLRAGGAVAGVVLEAHLKEIADKHQVRVPVKNPTLADYNQALKDADIFDIPAWRGIQHLGDIRNVCDHKKDREPTSDEVDELISGTDRVAKTLS